MKTILALGFLLLFISCKQEEIQSFEDLTQIEQDAIRNASRDKCLSLVAANYTKFKNDSNKVFDSTSYDRERGFYHEYKLGSEVKRKMDIRIWKRDADADEIYFYITETQLASESYFLRITKAQNEEMIDDLKADHCVRSPARVYDSTISSASLSVKYEYDKSNAPNTDEYIDTYSLPFSSLAMFANFRLTRKITTKDSDDDVVGSPANYSSTLVAKNYDFEGYTDPTNAARYTQKFCDFQYETGTQYRFSQETTNIGFKWTCTTGAVPVGWDLTL